MSTKTVYIYNQDGEYIGEGLAYEDPMVKGRYALPFNSTDKKPPATKSGKVAKWVDDKWEVVPDYRGKTVYNTNTTQPVTVDYIGKLKDGYTDIAPPNGEKYIEWVGGKWVGRPLTQDEQKQENQNKIIELKQYLADTDYAIIKIAEGVAKSNKYEDILTKRKETRKKINKLEKVK